jgi:hypothetical protein
VITVRDEEALIRLLLLVDADEGGALGCAARRDRKLRGELGAAPVE